MLCNKYIENVYYKTVMRKLQQFLNITDFNISKILHKKFEIYK